jgi:hypothetical protein
MSELHNRPVNNGDRLAVTTAFYKGLAGVRCNARGGEFACPAEQVFLRDRTGTIAGRPIRILDLQKSAVSTGLLVAQFEYVETAQ